MTHFSPNEVKWLSLKKNQRKVVKKEFAKRKVDWAKVERERFFERKRREFDSRLTYTKKRSVNSLVRQIKRDSWVDNRRQRAIIGKQLSEGFTIVFLCFILLLFGILSEGSMVSTKTTISYEGGSYEYLDKVGFASEKQNIGYWHFDGIKLMNSLSRVPLTTGLQEFIDVDFELPKSPIKVDSIGDALLNSLLNILIVPINGILKGVDFVVDTVLFFVKEIVVAAGLVKKLVFDGFTFIPSVPVEG